MVAHRIADILDKHPYRATEEEARAVQSYCRSYPFFQAAHAWYAKYVKLRHPAQWADMLALTAALTPQRERLHEWMEEDPEPEKILNQQTHLPAPAFSPNELAHKHSPSEETPKGISAPPQKTMTYTEWVKYLSRRSSAAHPAPQDDKTMALINRFLERQPRIKADKNVSTPPPPQAEESVREHEGLMTETLARLYETQGKYRKAIQAYEILKLKYPEKSRYFASEIKRLRKVVNSKK